MSEPVRIAMDSCVILDALEEDPKWWPEIEPIFADAHLRKVDIVVSDLQLTEVCRIKELEAKGITPDEATQMLEEWFDHAFILKRPAGEAECKLAAQFVRTHEIETCDAIIVATAILHRSKRIYTRDGMPDGKGGTADSRKKRRKKRTSLIALDGKLCGPDGPPYLEIKAPCSADYLSAPLFKKDPDGAS